MCLSNIVIFNLNSTSLSLSLTKRVMRSNLIEFNIKLNAYAATRNYPIRMNANFENATIIGDRNFSDFVSLLVFIWIFYSNINWKAQDFFFESFESFYDEGRVKKKRKKERVLRVTRRLLSLVLTSFFFLCHF